MELPPKEIMFEYVPTTQEVETLLQQTPGAKINIANTKHACDISQIKHLTHYGYCINGINIEIDMCDESELEPLWSFLELDFLRISFISKDVLEDDFKGFLTWLENADKLEALSLETQPLHHENGLHLLSIYFASSKQFPVSLFIKHKETAMAIPELPSLQVFHNASVEMSIGIF
ncbi:hypothetical protein [Moritella viscosa]|uniref:Uncharacterized protein n=1 Tax=Moritella viscosa TaxID=80854 RepID=A0A090IE93_9GAMM|nr:hypothetical protein [Moritella viscosa]CED60366.1 putative uncharacterized protein [Moritella viscosa]SGY97993.1 Putative uncharacterized protein [Moritella viscosa]SGZ11680.1 Putative uncharacterized protein [Moritella viscosa]SGZ11811.1 Putative uncharacterized protein [Moritella viscosa]SHO12429.1 Putative uncharacterized protein [Moritella viscosa]